MELGAFSVSLNVADIAASKDFYAKLGFEMIGGDPAEGWAILRNGGCTIGLFKGMIDRTTLTFNPGWTQSGDTLEAFEDIRDIQARLKAAGIAITREAEPGGRGPASFMVSDPDGNPILVDQHVDAPG